MADEPISREDDIDDHEYQVREVYAQFGLAIYLSQVLEHGAVTALVMARTAQGEFTDVDDFNAAWDEHFNHTLGKLLRQLNPNLDDNTALQTLLSEALAKRNEFAHRFFREHAIEFTSTEGRERMLTECYLAQHLFVRADAMLDAQLDDLMGRAGYNPEQVRRDTEAWIEAHSAGRQAPEPASGASDA